MQNIKAFKIRKLKEEIKALEKSRSHKSPNTAWWEIEYRISELHEKIHQLKK